MITVAAERIFPRFLLDDKTGAAMAKAVEKGLQIFCRVVAEGIDNAVNVGKMPVWRLDMLAEEFGIFYDYSADIATKRGFIRNAYLDYGQYGTAAAVERMAAAYLQKAVVLENSVNGYNTSFPYINQFAIAATEEWTPAQEASVNAAAEAVKNVRSEYMGIHRAYEISLDVEFTNGETESSQVSAQFLERFRDHFAERMKQMNLQIDGEWTGFDGINYIARFQDYRGITDEYVDWSGGTFTEATGVIINGQNDEGERTEYYRNSMNLPAYMGNILYIFLLRAYQREELG